MNLRDPSGNDISFPSGPKDWLERHTRNIAENWRAQVAEQERNDPELARANAQFRAAHPELSSFADPTNHVESLGQTPQSIEETANAILDGDPKAMAIAAINILPGARKVKSLPATGGATKRGPRFLTDARGNTIDLNFSKGLSRTNVTTTGSRGGVQYPLQGQQPNSYANLGNGHAVVYGPSGRALYDVSGSRIKVLEWNKAPNGQWYPRKGSDTKAFEGNVPKSVLDDLELN